jgi:glycosyltransferase involved in cell wall biosynthesis
LACSPALFAKWSQLNTNTHLVPNGVDVAHFAHAGHLPLPKDVAHLPGPVLGYTGTLHDERIDVDLVVQIASERPDWQVLFVGPNLLAPASRALLERLPNVHLIGPRPYHELPAYMSLFDACIIPHRVTPFTESLNPIKLYEYLATGLPIVSTAAATAREFGAVVYLAGDRDQFVAQLECALAERGDRLRRRRLALARELSWDGRVRTIAALLAAGRGAALPAAGPARTTEAARR